MSHTEETRISRREFFLPFIAGGVMLGSYGPLGMLSSCRRSSAGIRQFHACISSQTWEAHPELPSLIKTSGITDVWLGAFFYGKWYRRPEELRKMADQLEQEGFRVHIVNVPLGHPGDALGMDEQTDYLATPPNHWKNACTVDGRLYSGTSIHPPAVEENVQALKELHKAGFGRVFLDDDFRVGRMPGIIGGCFCGDCKDGFLRKYGLSEGDWEDLVHSVETRQPGGVLRSWVEHICAIETGMFNALQQAVPEMELGNMVMYLGSEKAGIELDRYREVPFRVGEFMFDDRSFGSIKGKTDELFSVLFHRRFARPELAFSETTAFPADGLSAENLAAKLHISTLTDVRNTLFMSGLLPYPFAYWEVLAPVIRKSAAIHELLAGHRPAGPFRHFWGWDNRLVGTDRPFSLFLASGIPFEVTEDLTADGWIFLSDEDARAVSEGRLKARASNLVIRKESGLAGSPFRTLDEDLDELMAFKREIIPDLEGIPYVDGKVPAVFAWYPSARYSLLWNVNETSQEFRIIQDGRMVERFTLAPLDIKLIQSISGNT
jgi:hypothetical protein